MKKLTTFCFVIFVFFTHAYAQTNKQLKVFISVDMEGCAGVVNWEEVSRNGKDYNYFRKIMAEETNAAIEGAIAAGATDIIVRDSHGSARNILPGDLDERAKLIRGWSGGIMSMMENIDATFDAVVFIGYHAKAGTPNATLDHTMSSASVRDISVNGISLPEAGINALIAGYYDVPVVFVAGDKAICEQSKQLFNEIEAVAIKDGIGDAAICLHPEVAQEKIREGVNKALKNLSKYKPYKLKPPYTLKITLLKEDLIHNGSAYPGVMRTGDWELTYKTNDLYELFRAHHWLY